MTQTTDSRTSAVDPITTEVLRNAFVSIAEDMNASLVRSAYSLVIYQVRDTAVALIDANFQVLAHSSGVAFFLGTLEKCLAQVEAELGRDIWRPGDVWLLNDAYLTGGHLHDIVVFAPVFHGGELVAFTASVAHHMDIGSTNPGGASTDSTEIFQEGLRIGPTKLVEGGKRREDIFDILARNSRLPRQLLGDLSAQLVASDVGERRFVDLLDKYGTDAVWSARDEIFRQTDAIDREAIRAIPDGTYTAEGCIDSDGIVDEPLWVRLDATVEGERIILDLTRSDDQAMGPVNSGRLMAITGARCAFKRVVSPLQPVNGGSFRGLEVVTREGSLFDARPPAPSYYYYSSLGVLVDLLARALAPVIPDAVAAAHYGDSSSTLITGTNPRNGERFVDYQAHNGGWGGWKGGDGESAMWPASLSQVKDQPIEVVETRHPLRISHYGMRPDSCGQGQWRGGFGVIREYVIDCDDATATSWFERSRTPAWGLVGGGDATPPDIVLNPGSAEEKHFLKVTRLPLKRGDVVRTMTGGGGGYGNPSDRDPALIEQDLRDGLITEPAASDA